MKKRLLKTGLYTLLILIFGIIGTVIFSPYSKKDGNAIRTVEKTVLIHAPTPFVFRYLGNSENAGDWSTYIDHITPLNTTEVTDGEIGSIRRCYKNADETGIVWDEKILTVIPNKKRVLSVYNRQGFALDSKDMETAQLYEALDSKTTSLTFSLYFKDGKAGWWDQLKMHFASYKISAVFEANLEQIKQLVEQKFSDSDQR